MVKKTRLSTRIRRNKSSEFDPAFKQRTQGIKDVGGKPPR